MSNGFAFNLCRPFNTWISWIGRFHLTQMSYLLMPFRNGYDFVVLRTLRKSFKGYVYMLNKILWSLSLILLFTYENWVLPVLESSIIFHLIILLSSTRLEPIRISDGHICDVLYECFILFEEDFHIITIWTYSTMSEASL